MVRRNRSPWVPAPQAAELLGLSKSAVYGRVQAGTLEAKKRDGRLLVRLPDPPADPVDFEGTIDIYEVAILLDMHHHTARRIVDRGELPMLRRGREIRFRREDVEVYIERRRVKPGDLAWNGDRPGWARRTGRL